jgi:hypothetical protein
VLRESVIPYHCSCPLGSYVKGAPLQHLWDWLPFISNGCLIS